MSCPFFTLFPIRAVIKAFLPCRDHLSGISNRSIGVCFVFSLFGVHVNTGVSFFLSFLFFCNLSHRCTYLLFIYFLLEVCFVLIPLNEPDCTHVEFHLREPKSECAALASLADSTSTGENPLEGLCLEEGCSDQQGGRFDV